MISARRIDATSIDPDCIPNIILEYKTRLASDALWEVIYGVDADRVLEASKSFFPLLFHHAKGTDVVTPRNVIRWET